RNRARSSSSATTSARPDGSIGTLQEHLDPFQDSVWNPLTIKAGDGVAFVRSVQPRVGQPVVRSHAHGKNTAAGPNPVERYRAVGFRRELRQGDPVRQRAYEGGSLKNSELRYRQRSFTVPVRCCT